MPDPTKNIKKGIGIGIIIGFIISCIANGWVIVAADPELTQKMAEGYSWILPGVGATGLLISYITKTKHKAPTTMRGFFIGLGAITAVINIIVIKVIPLFQPSLSGG